MHYLHYLMLFEEMDYPDPNYVLEVLDEGAEEEEEESEWDEGEDESESNSEEEQADVPSVGQPLQSDVTLTRVLQDNGTSTSSEGDVNIINLDGSRNVEYVRSSQKKAKDGEMKEKEISREEWNRDEIDGLFCPICMEAWTSGGDHQICCLSCGHIYGLSCIRRWLQQGRSEGKCPQCNKKCTLKSIRVLYASHVFVVDEELQQKVRTLEAKCTSLEKRDGDWCKKEDGWQKREADLQTQLHHFKERTSYLEGLLADVQRRPSELSSATRDGQGHSISGPHSQAEVGRWESLKRFAMLKEWQIDRARFFDVDAFGHTVVIARKLSGTEGSHTLTKISLLAPHERENIQLPLSIKVVKDLHMSAHARLALLASLGRKLSVISMESNNTVLTYDLPTAAWSCTWDPNDSHYVYTGLQNGMVMKLDLRQTLGPVESRTGLTANPVHSIQCLSTDSTIDSGSRSVITASSVGLCHWNFGSSGERPFLVPESENHGVCISLACCPRSSDIVASFRPKIEMVEDTNASQPLPTFSSSLLGQGVRGSHVFYKRTGSTYQKLTSTCANVNDIRLPKSALVDSVYHKSLFVSADEVTQELVLQELPSFVTFQHLNTRKHPIRDIKYSTVLNNRLLGCLSEDTLQLFSAEEVLG